MNLKILFISIYSATILLLFLLGILAFLLVQNSIQLEESNKINLKSHLIAEELRQSSDDLTRYCRTYVLTGDSIWESKYWTVLDIRNGFKPRPDGRKIALQDSMKKLGFTKTEFDKLKQAEKNSNDLVWTERVAFNAMKGLFDDGTGNFTVKGNPNPEFARKIMFDEKYHSDKFKIMAPIDEFIVLMHLRNKKIVEGYEKTSNLLLSGIVSLIVIIIAISLFSYFLIKTKIIEQMAKLSEAKEQAIRNEKQFRNVFHYSAIGMALISPQGKWLKVNKCVCDILGFNEDELRQKTFQDLTHPDDLDEGLIFVRQLLDGEIDSFSMEKRYIHKDGHNVWGEVTISLLHDENGDPLHFIAQIEDISDRKITEQNLLESKTRATAMLNAIPDLMFSLNSDGVFLDYKADEKELYTPNIIGKKNRDIAPPDFAELIDSKIKETLDSGALQNFEYKLNIRNETKDFEARMVPNGNDGVIAIVRDITDRKMAEEAIIRSSKLESLGALAGGIAHDFNNLLSEILGNIELAKYKDSEKDIESYLNLCLDSIERGHVLAQQLITFALGGEPIKKLEKIDNLLKEVTKFALSGSKVVCNYNIASDLMPCNVDRNQITQVIENLVINAVQAMPNGGQIFFNGENIEVKEYNEIGLKCGSYVKLTIRDQGDGISKGDLNNIFDPFFSTKIKGRGIGLTTVHSIIKRHNGLISVDSEVGSGTTITLYLPSVNEKVSFEKTNDLLNHRGSGTMVVLDDEPGIQIVLKEILTEFGYTVVTKDTGEDVVDFVKKEINEGRKITGMIFDITVPDGKGGPEIVEEIRKLTKDAPVFVMSGYSDDPIMSDPKKYGFTSSLIKPFRMKALSAMLNKYMPIDS